MAAELRFLENWHAVASNLEPASARGYKLHLLGRKRATELGRQTDGPWLVVSNRTVLYRDHCLLRTLDSERSALTIAAVGRDMLWTLIDVERIPVREGIEHHRVATLRFVAPHRPNTEQHHVTLP